jgi:hypothetical protein
MVRNFGVMLEEVLKRSVFNSVIGAMGYVSK